MLHPPGLMTRLIRMLVAFGVFVAVLCGLLYLAFEVKFQPIDFYTKKENNAPAGRNPQTFYRTVGDTRPGAGIAELSKPNTLGRKYTLEIAVEPTREAAEAKVDALIRKGIQAYYTPVQIDGQLFFRVRRGVYENTLRAARAAAELKSQKNIDAKVIQLR